MRNSTHDELREQAAAFALGALGDDDRGEFEAHLLVCDECDDEVRSFTRVATALAYAVPPVEPAASLRGRAVDAVRASASPLRKWRCDRLRRANRSEGEKRRGRAQR